MPIARTLATAAVVSVCGALITAPSSVRAQKRQRDVITRDELLASPQRDDDLYAAVRSLRPRFLEPPRGVRTLGNGAQPVTIVVLDGKPMGGLSVLGTLTTSLVAEVRYLEPSKAEMEYGQTAGGGAVVVKLYRQPKVTKDASAAPDTLGPHRH